MLGKDLSQALSDISDDKIEAAANYAPKGRRQLWVRVAACAAVLALLVTGAFFAPGVPQEVPDGTGGTQIVRKPMLGVQVYAADGLMDINEETDEPIFAGETIKDDGTALGMPTDGRLYRYNSITGEWEDVYARERLPKFDLIIWVEEEWEGQSPKLMVYYNGEKVDFTDKNSTNFRRGLAGLRDGRTGWHLSCSFEDVATLEIVVENQETGEVLLKYVIKATPAVFEKKETTVAPDGSAVTQLVANEGYMLEVKEMYPKE